MKCFHLLLLFFFFQSHFHDGLSKFENLNIENTDKETLLSFKLKITDPKSALSGWGKNSSHCIWHGVSCTIGGARVQSLILPGLGLFGSLPPHLSNLTFLRMLDLSNNSFHGQIPSEFGLLLHIRHINLGSNSINGTIPIGLSKCNKLRSINLMSNQLTGNLPPELGLLERLKSLSISGNNLTGVIPPSIGNLSSLTNISLEGNHFHGEISTELGRLHNLQEMRLTHNYFTGIFPTSIFNISSLVYLSLTTNSFSGKLPNDIGLALPNLQVLYLSSNSFEGMIPSSLFNSSKIIQLDLSSNGFRGLIPLFRNMNKLSSVDLGTNFLTSNTAHNFQLFESLRNCTQLQFLRLYGNRLAGELPSSVANLSTTLQVFCVDDNMLNGCIPHGIGNFPNLFSLSLERNFFTGEIPKSLGALNKLQRLTLFQNRFYGEIPDIFSNLTLLAYLLLNDNHFSGRIPPSIGVCPQLIYISLQENRLTGSIPKEIFGLPGLVVLLLMRNSLSGPIPSEVGNLKQLQSMDVSGNQLSGNLSESIGGCAMLQVLILATNNISGSVPKSIGKLRSLVTLNLSSNNFSGPIPEELGELKELKNLNLSFNQLEGEVPTTGIFKNLSGDSLIQRNNRLCGCNQTIAGKLGLPICPMQIKKRHFNLLPAFASVAGLILLISLMLFLSRASNSRETNKKRNKRSSSFPPLKGLPQMISYSDILVATNNFDAENLIGKGGFGSVFKGNFGTDENGILAVKVLDMQLSKASQSFTKECETLRSIRHRNLVKVVTSCSSVNHNGDEFKALIMEFMSNGNLEQWLYPNDTESGICLTLLQRLQIAIDVGSAMDYLHHDCDPPIVHCDLKPGNVLLDDDMVAHVGDFGLARFIYQNSTQRESSTIGLRGSIGYIAPEYGLGGKASTSGDVYSFGILLLEMITARKPTDDMFKEGLSLENFAWETNKNEISEIVDSRLFKYYESRSQSTESDHLSSGESSNGSSTDDYSFWQKKGEECVAFVIGVGLSCAAQSASDRITMRQTLKKLLEIKKVLLSS